VVTYSLVKTASDEAGDSQLAREAQWLRELADVRSLEGQLPRLLDEGTNDQGRRFLVASVAQGWVKPEPSPPAMNAPSRTWRARWLHRLQVSGLPGQISQSLPGSRRLPGGDLETLR
jgi:hypothetical protein